MDFKRTKLTVLITTIIATGCSANKLDSNTDRQGYCRNGGESSDYSCNKEQQTDIKQKQATVNNPNTEAWMNSKLTDIKSWLKTIKENPNSAAVKPNNSNAALMVRNPAANDPELIRIETLTQNGSHREAMAAINTYLAQNPDNLEAELTKGLVLVNMGQDKEAELLLRNSITRHPTSPELYNNLAVIYSNKGNYGKAIETLLLAFSTHPSYAQVNENLREVYASVASSAYNRALDLDSDKKLTPELVVLRRTSMPSLPAVATSSLSTSIALNDNTSVVKSSINTQLTANQTAAIKPSATKLSNEAKQLSVANSTATPIEDLKSAASSESKTIVNTGRKQVRLPLPKLSDPEPKVEIAKLKIKPEPSKTNVKKSIVRVDNNSTKKAAKAPGSSTVAAVKAVNRWSWTWTSQNVNAYIGSYVQGYTPKKGVNHSQWKKLRTKRLTRPSFIKVQLSDIQSKRISNNIVEVTFLQKYQANAYKDQTKKRLTLTRVGPRWLISKEKNI
jgi:Flp pilus assembly protein TadD